MRAFNMLVNLAKARNGHQIGAFDNGIARSRPRAAGTNIGDPVTFDDDLLIV
jgi:hypothetical protein